MLRYEQADTIVAAALSYARDQSLPPMTVAVLDAGGNLVAFGREDDSSLLRERIARGKAHGALHMGVGSRALVSRARSHPYFFGAVTALADGNLVPVPGGVLIRDAQGRIVGAVGVSGDHPDRDEACAIAGIERAQLAADPGIE
jgi:uncharacterized protein GlcG (DUF336 family)